MTLPPPPSSYDALTPEQMTHLNRLRHEHGHSESEFMLHAFMCLTRIAIVKGEYIEEEDGTTSYLFQQVDDSGNPYGEKFPLSPAELHFFIEKFLPWINKECDRLADLYPTLELDGKRFGSPGYAMANMTYQQHRKAQDYIALFYRQTKKMEGIIKKGDKAEEKDVDEFKRLLKAREESRCRFLATIYSPEVSVSGRTIDGEVVNYDEPERKFIFGTAQIEANYKLFEKIDIYQTESIIQLFSGVMLHYKKIFPLLFKEGDGGSADFINVEQSTMNALQSELQFSNYQTIYDSNAPFILGKLNAIIQKAKALEEQALRMKIKSRH